MSIQSTYRMGEDALQNLFEITFSLAGVPVPGLPDAGLAWALRAQNFNVPTSGVQTYEVHYKTHVVERISGKGETPKEFSFDIRIDRFWGVYKLLTLWKNAAFGTWDNEMGTDYLSASSPESYRAPLTVKPVGADGKILSTQQLGGLATAWQFEGCYVKTLGEIPFDYTAGEPLVINVTFGCLGMKDFLA